MSDFPQRTLLRTMWIGFFLGPFGVHRFYTGYKGSAIGQFFVCGVTTLWLLVDIGLIIAASVNGVPFAEAVLEFGREHWISLLFIFPFWGVGFAWVSADMARIVAGRFKDALGRPLLTSDEPTK